MKKVAMMFAVILMSTLTASADETTGVDASQDANLQYAQGVANGITAVFLWRFGDETPTEYDYAMMICVHDAYLNGVYGVLNEGYDFTISDAAGVLSEVIQTCDAQLTPPEVITEDLLDT